MTETMNDDERELMLFRLEEAYLQGKLMTIHTIDGKTYTPEEQVNEARAGTPIGNEFLSAEKKLNDFLKSKL